MVTKQKLISLLEDKDREQVEQYASYCSKIQTDPKNTFMAKVTDEYAADLFRRVSAEGLFFDGKHITLQSTGISYDYVAYKNKMLLAYPESKIDLSLVFDGDTFEVAKESGGVIYTHAVKNPFGQKDDELVGGYCVIRNKRGEFLTTLSAEEIEKHRKVAKTDFIWRQWFKEMALKTVIKKACKLHFADVYDRIEDMDNENYSLENPLNLELKYKSEIDAISSKEELATYYSANKGKGKDFDTYIVMRQKQLTQS